MLDVIIAAIGVAILWSVVSIIAHLATKGD